MDKDMLRRLDTEERSEREAAAALRLASVGGRPRGQSVVGGVRPPLAAISAPLVSSSSTGFGSKANVAVAGAGAGAEAEENTGASVTDETGAQGEGDDGDAVAALFAIALPLVRQGYTAMVDDSFTRCFKSKKVVRWNWNCYLWPVWILGVCVRYFLLFPLRLLGLTTGFVATAILFPLVKFYGVFFDSKAYEIL